MGADADSHDDLRTDALSSPFDQRREQERPDTALWLERHGAALRRYFRRRVDAADVDDLVQDVLIKLQTATINSDVAGAERYLFTVARNILIDHKRAQQSRDPVAYETYAKIDGIADPLSPERILLARDEYARTRQAVMNLPPRARAALEFHRFENMTYDEVAATMRISRDAVKKLLHRALTSIAIEIFGPGKGDE